MCHNSVVIKLTNRVYNLLPHRPYISIYIMICKYSIVAMLEQIIFGII